MTTCRESNDAGAASITSWSTRRPTEIYFRKQVARGVSAVTGAGGRGMTLAPAIAEESFQ